VTDVIGKLQGGLIVSCQAEERSPFNSPSLLAAFAEAAERGGAVGIRARDPENVRAIKARVRLPVIGITKGQYPNGEVLITPRREDVARLIEAGADIVAMDVTRRRRPDGVFAVELLEQLKAQFSIPIVADVSIVDEGIAAAEHGADLVATTLSGYTSYTRREHSLDEEPGPDLELVQRLAEAIRVPVIAEGRYWRPEQARRAIELGAWAVVVGTAITRPTEMTRRFVRALQRH